MRLPAAAGTDGDTAAVRRAAAGIVADIAERLQDPADVVRMTTVAGSDAAAVDGEPLWVPQSLTRGYPAISLLYAELGRSDSRFRNAAHRYLGLAALQRDTAPLYGQLDGLAAVATALRIAAHDDKDYATILSKLDEHVIANTRRLIAMHHHASRNGLPTRPVVIDNLHGLAGLARHLLARPESCTDTLLDALSCLSSLRQPIQWHGVQVPGWWYHKTALIGENHAGTYEHGAATFGLSHGIAGPLAILSLSWQAGLRVPGQQEAIHVMAEWLLEWREHDTSGYYWPAHVPLGYYKDRSSTRASPSLVSWCRGSLGTARAVVLAGRALGRPEWTRAAMDVVQAIHARPAASWGIRDNSLCHGWAGALHQLCRFSWDSTSPSLPPAAHDAAHRLIGSYQADAPFCYQYSHPGTGQMLNLPGLLEGVTGIALALRSYAIGQPPASGWDTILMLS